MKKNIFSIICVTFLSSCSAYSGTKTQDQAFTLAYHSEDTVFRDVNDDGEVKLLNTATDFLIGLAFDWAADRVTEMRTSEYSKEGIFVPGLSTFGQRTRGSSVPGCLVIVRTIKDPGGEFSNIASVANFRKNSENTPASRLLDKISRSSDLSENQLARTITEQLDRQGKVGPNDRIAFLALCPISRLSGVPSGSDTLYGISFGGMYYPLLGASRFKGEGFFETNKIARRFVDSKEAVQVELYGPNGSGYTSGIVNIPVAWAPPQNRNDEAEWISPQMISEGIGLNTDEILALKKALNTNAGDRLSRRSAFVSARSGIAPHLRANISLTENSDVTGWLLKGLEKLQEEVE